MNLLKYTRSLSSALPPQSLNRPHAKVLPLQAHRRTAASANPERVERYWPGDPDGSILFALPSYFGFATNGPPRQFFK